MLFLSPVLLLQITVAGVVQHTTTYTYSTNLLCAPGDISAKEKYMVV